MFKATEPIQTKFGIVFDWLILTMSFIFIVLGVAKELLENVKGLRLERHAPVAAVVWYHPIGAPGIPKGMMSPEAFDSFTSNMSNTINALSSSSSVGGGFSGGGGGGGDGGGSGAG
jgi:uncharacterized membrane protein YgcG